MMYDNAKSEVSVLKDEKRISNETLTGGDAVELTIHHDSESKPSYQVGLGCRQV
jgi:hemin uptake protein HemP